MVQVMKDSTEVPRVKFEITSVKMIDCKDGKEEKKLHIYARGSVVNNIGNLFMGWKPKYYTLKIVSYTNEESEKYIQAMADIEELNKWIATSEINPKSIQEKEAKVHFLNDHKKMRTIDLVKQFRAVKDAITYNDFDPSKNKKTKKAA